MQVLDQQIAPARTISQKRSNFIGRDRVHLSALRRAAGPIAGTPNRGRWRRFRDTH
jgi:hypothetical protein